MVEMRYQNRRRWSKLLLVSAVVVLFPDRPVPLHRNALDEVAAVLEAKVFRLKSDLHTPDLTGESMQVPTFEGRGWHHHNPSGAVVLKAGSRVEVTGVFNYAERGFFLELAGEEAGSGDDIAVRPRARIRFMVESPGANPEAQRTEALSLVARVLDFTTP